MNKILIQNPRIINEGRSFIGSVLVEGDKIAAVFEGEVPGNVRAEAVSYTHLTLPTILLV